MRWVSTRVLPEPAPATISSGPPACTTAARWASFRSSTSSGLTTAGRCAGKSSNTPSAAMRASLSTPGTASRGRRQRARALWRFLGCGLHVDADGVVAGGAVGGDRGALGGLGLPGSVGRAHGDRVPTRGGVPRQDPLPPAVDVEWRRQVGLRPGAVVDAHLDPFDAPGRGPGDAGDRCATGHHRRRTRGHVDARLGLDRPLARPSSWDPVALHQLEGGQLDRGQPLGRRHVAVQARYDQAGGEAVHGFPARLVVPGLYGYVSATKWLSSIELTTFELVQGYWIPRGWAREGPVKTQSRIDVPSRAATVVAG